MKRLAALAMLAVLGLSIGSASAQVPTQGLPARFIAAFPGAGIETSALLGAYVKSITPAGVATVQLDDETETTVTLTAGGGGATITSGTADPTGGSNGDAYLQVDASDVIQSIWLNVSGTWSEFTIPTAGTSTDDQTAAEVNTDTTNFGGHLGGTDTTVQAALDTLDDITAGRTLSDAAAQDVSTGASAAGTSADVSRADHVHGSAADVHTTSANATQGTDTRVFTLTGLTPAITTPVVGTTLVFKTPTPLTTNTNDGVFLRIGTTNYSMTRPPGLPIRVSTLAANTPYIVVFDGTDFELLDTTLGIPRGGDDNQVLRKTSNADYAVAWEDESGGGLNQAEVDARIAALRPNVFTADAQTTQTGDSFVVAALTPSFVNPEIGYTVVFVTPTTIADGGAAMLRINGVDRSIRFPGNLEVDIEAFEPRQAYIAVFDGGQYEVVDNNVNADWDATAGDAQILNKPTLVTTFTGDTDTPDNYTNAARQFTRVNAAASAIEFVPEPANANTIPHVGRLPDVTDDSPVLVFLTHDEISGNRQDATITIGESLGRYCGYSRGNIFDGFGTLSEDSPIEMVFGIIQGADCTFSTVVSFNEGFIDDIRQIVFTVDGTPGSCNMGVAYQEYGATTKRITSCGALENVDVNSFTFNFLYEDGTTAYWNDGSVDHRAGLYEKVGMPPVYHDLAPPEDAHRTGEGSAACGDSEPPDAAGQLCVTSDGRGYFAMPRTSLITTPASITVAGVGSDLFIPDVYTTGSLEGRANLNDGNFLYLKTTQEFYQYQDPDFEVVTWEEAWQYIIDEVGDTATRQTFLASVWLGEFASESEVQRDRDGYTDDTVEYYFLYSDFGTLIHITEFTNSVRETISEGFVWRGPVIIPEEVLDVVDANPADEIDEPLDSILIGSQRYSVIVRPGTNGQLRDATAADYDATYARSKVVAVVDGDFYKVSRTLTAAHTATGTFTEYARSTTFDYDGVTYRYAGVYPNDTRAVHNAVNSFYYNTTTHYFRLHVAHPVSGSFWTTLPNGVGLLAAWQWVDTVANERDALAHATANGQKFAYQDSNGDWAVYELSAFTAAEPAHYEYEWRSSTVPADDSQDNVTLVDDVSLTWNAAFRSSLEFEFSEALTEATDDQTILFDFFPNGTNAVARDPGDLILAEHVRAITEVHPLRLTKAGGGGGGDPVDQNAQLLAPRPTGYIHFHLPISSGEFTDRRLTLFYTGDHVTDLDGQIGIADTTLTVSTGDTADLVVGEDYWLGGPTTGDCQSSPYFEKITIETIVDGDDITVTRGVDGTGLTGLTCFMNSGADVIHDDKRTFILESTHADQDSAQVSFTLIATGGSAGAAETVTTPAGSFTTTDIGSTTTQFFTNTSGNWVGTGMILPAHVDGVDRWILTHLNKGEWHWHRTSDYSGITVGVVGEAIAEGMIWDRSLEYYSNLVRTTLFGISATRELLIAVQTINNDTYVTATIDSFAVRAAVPQ